MTLYLDKNQNQIVWVGGIGCVTRYNSKTFKMLGKEDAHPREIVFSLIPVNHEIWSASNDRTIGIFDAETGAFEKSLEGHIARVNSLVIVGRYVWSCSWDKDIYVWDGVTHNCVMIQPKKHNDSILHMCVVKPIAGQYQVWSGGGSRDGTICIFKTKG